MRKAFEEAALVVLAFASHAAIVFVRQNGLPKPKKSYKGSDSGTDHPAVQLKTPSPPVKEGAPTWETGASEWSLYRYLGAGSGFFSGVTPVYTALH